MQPSNPIPNTVESGKQVSSFYNQLVELIHSEDTKKKYKPEFITSFESTLRWLYSFITDLSKNDTAKYHLAARSVAKIFLVLLLRMKNASQEIPAEEKASTETPTEQKQIEEEKAEKEKFESIYAEAVSNLCYDFPEIAAHSLDDKKVDPQLTETLKYCHTYVHFYRLIENISHNSEGMLGQELRNASNKANEILMKNKNALYTNPKIGVGKQIQELNESIKFYQAYLRLAEIIKKFEPKDIHAIRALELLSKSRDKFYEESDPKERLRIVSGLQIKEKRLKEVLNPNKPKEPDSKEEAEKKAAKTEEAARNSAITRMINEYNHAHIAFNNTLQWVNDPITKSNAEVFLVKSRQALLEKPEHIAEHIQELCLEEIKLESKIPSNLTAEVALPKIVLLQYQYDQARTAFSKAIKTLDEKDPRKNIARDLLSRSVYSLLEHPDKIITITQVLWTAKNELQGVQTQAHVERRDRLVEDLGQQKWNSLGKALLPGFTTLIGLGIIGTCVASFCTGGLALPAMLSLLNTCFLVNAATTVAGATLTGFSLRFFTKELQPYRLKSKVDDLIKVNKGPGNVPPSQ